MGGAPRPCPIEAAIEGVEVTLIIPSWIETFHILMKGATQE